MAKSRMVVSSKRLEQLFLVNGLLWLCFLFLLSSCTPPQNTKGGVTATPPPIPTLQNNEPFIDTWNGIHLFQSFDYNIDNPAPIARYYDFVWGASPENVQIFRSANPHLFLSYYFSFFRDSGIFGQQSATHSLDYWKRVHPDWILYQCDRKTPAYEDGLSNVPFNFTNPAVISWEVQTYAQPASDHGYDAIAADNVNMENLIGACGYYENGQWVQRYSGNVNDLQWRTDVAFWITSMQQALHHLRHPLALIPNLGLGVVIPDDPQVQKVLSHIDGVLDESGFTDYGQGYVTGDKWLQTVQFIESVQQSGRAYFIENEFPTVGRSEIQWALASYLMCKEHLASVAITPIQGYGTDLRYSEYNAQIGSPADSMQEAQHVYWRTYTHGLSIVNPSATTAYTVALPSGEHFVDLYGNAVTQQVTLPAHSGMVLLTTSA